MTLSVRPLMCILLFATALASTKTPAQPVSFGQPIQPAPADPAIAAALTQVDPERIQATIAKLVSFKNRSTLSSMETDLPAGTGINAAADWIDAEFNRISADCGNCLEVKRDEFIEPGGSEPGSRILKPTKLTNVYAVLPGTDPAQAQRRVLVSGHYDSRNSDTMNTRDDAPGANDDASGVAVSLECARILSKLRFPATIVFVAVAGEEQGLNGSRHLAKLAQSERWQLEAVLNNDIVGGDTTPGDSGQNKSAVRVFSEGIPSPATPGQIRLIHTLGSESDSPSRELARAVSDTGRTYLAFRPVMIFRADRYLRGGDHTSFNQEGFAAVRFTEWRENFNHQHQNIRIEKDSSGANLQYGDLLQFVDFTYVANVARLNAAVLANLASAPGAPQNVHIVTTNLDNDTTLTWEPPIGAPAATTYQVLWRATEDPAWTTCATAGSALTLKLPVSKDNVIFGIRSADSAGHRSIAVLPIPTPRPTPANPANPANPVPKNQKP